jgi:hypothetical protein
MKYSHEYPMEFPMFHGSLTFFHSFLHSHGTHNVRSSGHSLGRLTVAAAVGSAAQCSGVFSACGGNKVVVPHSLPSSFITSIYFNK